MMYTRDLPISTDSSCLLCACTRTVLEACSQIQSSQALQELLSLILEVGNLLNANTARGNAKGFRMEALAKLRDTKATKVRPIGEYASVTNLLEFVSMSASDSAERISTELSSLKVA